MAKKTRVGILTGGGDVPGLNSVIKSVVYRGGEHDMEIVGLRRGWEGLTHLHLTDPDSISHYVIPLNRENTRTIDRTGGTILHSSRTNPSKMKKLPRHLEGKDFPTAESTKGGVTTVTYDVSSQVLENLQGLELDYLLAIGGDDTLSYAAKLHQLGFKVIAIPKTMDNDVRNTEYCIGFSTAITRAMDAVERQRTTVGSHERIGIFRVFGRDAGFTALYTAFVSSIRCLIPEYQPEIEKVVDLLVTDKHENPSGYSLVVMSEGASWQGYQVQEYGEPDAYGHRKKASVAESLSDEIKHRTGEETIVSRPHLRPPLRRPGLHRQAHRVHLRHDGLRRAAGGAERAHVRPGERQVRSGAHPGSGARAAQGGRRLDVQRRPAPSELRQQASPAGVPQPDLTRATGVTGHRGAPAPAGPQGSAGPAFRGWLHMGAPRPEPAQGHNLRMGPASGPVVHSWRTAPAPSSPPCAATPSSRRWRRWGSRARSPPSSTCGARWSSRRTPGFAR